MHRRGDPGPAGAGAVNVDGTGDKLARHGRSVGSRTGNNTAEYVGLQLGFSELVARYEPHRLDIRSDSRRVTRDVRGGDDPMELGIETYSGVVTGVLSSIPYHQYTYLADNDPNPADTLTPVGTDIETAVRG